MQLQPTTPDDDDLVPQLESAGQTAGVMRSHAEASLCATARLVDRNGIEWLITVSAGADGKDFVAFLDVLGAAGSYALAHGFGLVRPGPAPAPTPANGAPAQGAAAPAAATPTDGPPGGPAASPDNAAAGPPPDGGGDRTFACTELAASTTNGRSYWRVKGGSFAQYGIIVWPEVLDAADLADLDAAKVYDMQGWQATWVADAQGYRKVTRLAQVG